VKVGLLSDIHCNLEGLRRALAILGDCDQLLCAGDLLYQYRFSSDVLGLLRDAQVHSIVGNHDKTILHVPGHPLRSSPTVDPSELRYLGEIPESLNLSLGGARIAMFHGAPWDIPRDTSAHYVYATSQSDLRRVAEVDADVVVLGHTHIPFSCVVADTLIVNPGSVGECRDGSGLLSCAMLDTDDRRVEFRRFEV
jgi:putative phosphoesterase